jgi:hypothetical protein
MLKIAHHSEARLLLKTVLVVLMLLTVLLLANSAH